MDNQRLLLYMALGFVSLILYQNWLIDYHQPVDVPTEASSAAAPTSADVPSGVDLPTAVSGSDSPAQPVTIDKTISAPSVSVKTDVMDIEISTNGATITSVLLSDYPVSIDQPDEPFRLIGFWLRNRGCCLKVARYQRRPMKH